MTNMTEYQPVELTCHAKKRNHPYKWTYKGQAEYKAVCPNCGNIVWIHRPEPATETAGKTPS